MSNYQTKIKTQVCVIGGGMSGVCCAISAARHGLKVVLVQDRNVLGGNASSEIRMWIRGAGHNFPDFNESGIIHEIALDNIYYNPHMNFYLWDGVLYNKVVMESNITLLLGTTCIGATQQHNIIKNITVWEMQSYKKYDIEANYFVDCSGDCILAEFTNALYRKGREDSSEFNESLADFADDNTMGNSCLLQLRLSSMTTPHTPFPFENENFSELIKNRLDLDSFNYRLENFWWLELGGNKNALKDAQEINRDLLSNNYALYSYIAKNNKKQLFALDFLGSLPGKRETRRYEGDYILNQNDVENAQSFDDEIAYGGWKLDNHPPKGLLDDNMYLHNISLKQPYPIPYRCVYSKNIDNLLFAGRNISVTHIALSSTRVMGTCAVLGQAVGVACYIANKYKTTARGVKNHIEELQRTLLDDDCLLINSRRKLSTALHNSKIYNLIDNSHERKIGNEDKVLVLDKNQEIVIKTDKIYCKKIRLVFDSNLQGDGVFYPVKSFPMMCYNSNEQENVVMPQTLVKDFIIKLKINDNWVEYPINDNHNRLFNLSVDDYINEIRFKGLSTYGYDKIRLYSIDIL